MAATTAPRDRLRALRRFAAPAALLVLYVFPFPHFDFLRSPNELSRLYQVRAIVDDQSLAVNGPVARWGRVGDLSDVNGRLFPNKAPGVVFAGVPVYAAVRALAGAEEVSNRTLLWFLRLCCGVLPTLLLLGPLRRFAARSAGDARAAEAAVGVYALGTLAFPYSLLYFSHQLAAVLAAASFLLLDRARTTENSSLRALAGLLAGAAVVTEYTVAPVALLLASFGAWTARDRSRAAAWIVLGALPMVVALGAYHHAAFGHPLATGYSFVENRTFREWHAQGFMGVAAPSLTALAGNLFHAGRGLFAFSPVLLVAFAALPALWRRDRAVGNLTLWVVAAYLFLASAFLYQAWGWMLGPRHLTPLMPFLVAPLAIGIAEARRLAGEGAGTIVAGVVAGLAAVSVGVNALCSVVFPHIPEHYQAALGHLVGPLVRDGFVPLSSLELLLGRPVPGAWAAYFGLLALVALGTGALCLDRASIKRAAPIGLGTAAIFLVLVTRLPPPPTRAERDTSAWIRRNWEPAHRRAGP